MGVFVDEVSARIILSSVRSKTARGSRAFSASRFLQLANLVALQPAKFLTPPIIRHFSDADPANRVGKLCPCETSTSTCRSVATISSGLWPFLGIWSS